MADKDLSLFVFGEDTEPCVLSCAAGAAADSIDNGSSDDNDDLF